MDRLPVLYWMLRIGGVLGFSVAVYWRWRDYPSPMDWQTRFVLVFSLVCVAISFTNAI